MADAKGTASYDAFYEAGGWQYNLLHDWWWHRRHFVKKFGLHRGDRVLEVACGTGFHTDLFCRMGLDCIGFDTCETAVRIARERYPNRRFFVGDARGDLPVEHESMDAVVTRGCSIYHYDLAAQPALDTTANLLRYLRVGGRFVLIIASDLSGRREAGKIWQNRLEEYRVHLSHFGSDQIIEWHKGMVVCGVRKPA